MSISIQLLFMNVLGPGWLSILISSDFSCTILYCQLQVIKVSIIPFGHASDSISSPLLIVKVHTRKHLK